MSLEVGDVLKATATALLRVYLLFVPGVILAFYPREDPVLHPLSFGTLSRLLVNLWSPSLAFSALSQGASLQAMKQLWPLILFGFIRIAAGYIIGRIIYGIAWKLLVAKRSKDALEVSGITEFWFLVLVPLLGSFNNAAGIPLPLFEGLCSNVRPAELDQCEVDVRSYVFLLRIPYYFLWWGVGFPYLRYRGRKRNASITDETECLSSSRSTLSTTQRWRSCTKACASTACVVVKALINPVIIFATLGILAGLWPWLQSGLYEHSTTVLYQVGATFSAIGSVTIPTVSMIFSATFVHSLQKLISHRRRKRKLLEQASSDPSLPPLSESIELPCTLKPLSTLTSAQGSTDSDAEDTAIMIHRKKNGSFDDNEAAMKKTGEICGKSPHTATPRSRPRGRSHGEMEMESVCEDIAVLPHASATSHTLTLSSITPRNADDDFAMVPLFLALSFAFFNLVLMPSVILLCVYALHTFAPSALPEDNLATNAVIVVSSMPPAGIFIVVCHLIGLPKEAQRISYASMIIICCSMITIPTWCFVALYFFPPNKQHV